MRARPGTIDGALGGHEETMYIGAGTIVAILLIVVLIAYVF